MQAADIQHMIETGLPNAQAIVKGEGANFEAVVICADFAGKTPVKQHQMVYATLGDSFASNLHALSLQTFTPEQYQAQAHG